MAFEFAKNAVIKIGELAARFRELSISRTKSKPPIPTDAPRRGGDMSRRGFNSKFTHLVHWYGTKPGRRTTQFERRMIAQYLLGSGLNRARRRAIARQRRVAA